VEFTVAGESGPFTVSFSRAVNPATVNSTTLTLSRLGGGIQPGFTSACANSPCTQATVSPTSQAPLEGAYSISWSAGITSEGDGAALTAGSGDFKVEAYRRSDFTGCGFTGGMPPWACGADIRSTAPTRPLAVDTAHTTTSPLIQLRGTGGAFTLNFTATLVQGSGCTTDSGTIQVSLDGGAFMTVANVSTGTTSGPRPVPDVGNRSVSAQIRLIHSVQGSQPAGCTSGTGSFAVDDLVLTR